MSEHKNKILDLIPDAPDWKIDWQRIEDSNLRLMIQELKDRKQNPYWHEEGDVWTHTKMVCEALVQISEFRALEKRKQQELFLSALLHDLGKIPCTKLEDGVWTSPKHTIVGAKMARELLWKEFGMCGTKEWIEFRETICQLIRYHSVPPHILEQKKPQVRLAKIASTGKLVPDFSIRLLSILVEADMRGRISKNLEESLELKELCMEMAKEYGCLDGPILFPNAFSEYAFLSGRNIVAGQELYDDTWGEVVLMSGLPGTGKDTWIQENLSGIPMVSLDEIRKKNKISPKDNQGLVIQEAKKQAKKYLREQETFVWNATNLTSDMRGRLVELFAGYHAKVKIVYLETDSETQMQRNQNRKAEVPQKAVEDMLRNLVLPESYEAHRVEWHCV